MSVKIRWESLFALLIVGSLILAACGEEEPEVIEKEVTRIVKETVVETVVEKETVIETVVAKETVLQTVIEKETILETVVEEVMVTATPEGPTVGGRLVWHTPFDYSTLDPHLALEDYPLRFLGSSLVAMNPAGDYVPYLAESWEVSDDGLTWTFHLKQGVMFHDGTPLTAQDYAWTFNRAVDPATMSPGAGEMLGPLDFAEAVDDYTLVLNLQRPFFALLYSLSDAAYMQPLSRAAVEQWGEEYGRHPVGVGPYVFKEWVTGERVIMERNPAFNWGPAYAENKGPYYIDTIEMRIIPEEATMLAGLEAGELDVARVEPKSLERIENTGNFQIFKAFEAASGPYLSFPVNKPPFDDIRVRRAFNYAANREVLIEVAMQGNAVPLYGPVSQGQAGYWPGIEEIGYKYELEQAKALLAEAGWSDSDGDGVLDKDGQPLKFTLQTLTSWPVLGRVAEILQQEYKGLGVELDIQIVEGGVALPELMAGNYDVFLGRIGFGEADIMNYMFHSDQVGGGLNFSQVQDAELDELLEATRSETDPARRQEWVNAAQTRIVEQAYIVPLYTAVKYHVLAAKVKGAVFSPTAVSVSEYFLEDAYIVEE